MMPEENLLASLNLREKQKGPYPVSDFRLPPRPHQNRVPSRAPIRIDRGSGTG
jgi:hypothetical protein